MLMLLHKSHYVSSIPNKKKATTEIVLHESHYVLHDHEVRHRQAQPDPLPSQSHATSKLAELKLTRFQLKASNEALRWVHPRQAERAQTSKPTF